MLHGTNTKKCTPVLVHCTPCTVTVPYRRRVIQRRCVLLRPHGIGGLQHGVRLVPSLAQRHAGDTIGRGVRSPEVPSTQDRNTQRVGERRPLLLVPHRVGLPVGQNRGKGVDVEAPLADLEVDHDAVKLDVVEVDAAQAFRNDAVVQLLVQLRGQRNPRVLRTIRSTVPQIVEGYFEVQRGLFHLFWMPANSNGEKRAYTYE
jgi:hypothetical protein